MRVHHRTARALSGVADVAAIELFDTNRTSLDLFEACYSVTLQFMAEARDPRRWWGAKQAANYLEIHPITLRRRARRAVKKYASLKTGMPVVRFNGRGPFRFPIEAFKAWAEHPTD